jgi:hypothetical protein
MSITPVNKFTNLRVKSLLINVVIHTKPGKTYPEERFVCEFNSLFLIIQSAFVGVRFLYPFLIISGGGADSWS